MKRHSRVGYAAFDELSIQEHNDCAVRSVATAACIPYADSWALFTEEGRSPRARTSTEIMAKVIKRLFPAHQTLFLNQRLTLSQFAEQHPEGHWVLVTCDHAFALCDGITYDWSYRPRCRIRWAWRIV